MAVICVLRHNDQKPFSFIISRTQHCNTMSHHRLYLNSYNTLHNEAIWNVYCKKIWNIQILQTNVFMRLLPASSLFVFRFNDTTTFMSHPTRRREKKEVCFDSFALEVTMSLSLLSFLVLEHNCLVMQPIFYLEWKRNVNQHEGFCF